MHYCRLSMVILPALLSGTALAHDTILPHPGTHSELAHFILHLWIAAALIGGAGLLIRGIKRFLAKRINRQNDV